MNDRTHPGSSADNAPGLFRRLGAILYDTMLVSGLLLMAIIPVIIILGIVSGWDSIDTAGLRTNPFYIAYLLCIPFLFFVCFWKLAGQTLGMRTWRIRIVDNQGARVSWRECSCALFCRSSLLGGTRTRLSLDSVRSGKTSLARPALPDPADHGC